MVPRRSDIPQASAECRLSRSQRNEEEREKACAAAYHLRGCVMIDLSQPLEDWFRQSVVNWANGRWGTRLTKRDGKGGSE